jgi:hypothetical protein
LELAKKRKEHEAGEAAAVKRDLETFRLESIGKQQESEMKLVKAELSKQKVAKKKRETPTAEKVLQTSQQFKEPFLPVLEDTEPLCHDISKNRRKTKADNFLQAVLLQHPKLFEVIIYLYTQPFK